MNRDPAIAPEAQRRRRSRTSSPRCRRSRARTTSSPCCAASNRCGPDLPRFGRALRPAHEALRLGQEPELDFAPAALASFDPAPPARRAWACASSACSGPQGPMPLHFTEYVRERLRYRGDATAARFLDIFHHRLLLLFYRAWAQAQPAVHQDRPGDDRFAAWLGASCGLDGAAHGARALPESARLFQAGLLGARSRASRRPGQAAGQLFQRARRASSRTSRTGWCWRKRIAPGSGSRAAGRSARSTAQASWA